MKYTNLQQIKDLYCKSFYMPKENDTIIDCVLAICLATKLPGDSIWLMIVGAPSTGKTELVNIMNKVPHVHGVSTLTENTFLSSMRNANGKENSLLHRIGAKGMILMKDYTTVVSMRAEKKEQILAQMREIFDGALKKESGNGVSQEWKGKINWIGCVTDVIYSVGGESAAMGRRSMVYELPALTDDMRLDMGRAANKIRNNIGSIREELQDAVNDFIKYKIDNMPKELPSLSAEMEEDLLQISSFVTKVRTGVERDFRGTLQLVYESEGLTRFNSQITKTVETMLYISDKTGVDEDYKKFAFKIGIDSIPKQRRIALMILTEYAAVTAKGVAIKTGMPTETIRMALEELAALHIVERKPNPQGVGADHWNIKDRWRHMMIAYGGIEVGPVLEVLNVDDDETDVDISPSMKKVMGLTDDEDYNKEIRASQDREFNKFTSDLQKISTVEKIKASIAKKQFEIKNLDWSFFRAQSEVRLKDLTREIEELTKQLAELGEPQAEIVPLQSNLPSMNQ